MSDFVNKIISILLIFLMLVVGPMLFGYKSDEAMARRKILNDVEIFIDKIQDTSEISYDDLNQLYLDCNSHGITVDVKVKRLISTDVFDNDLGIAQTNYFAVDDVELLKNFNAGDIIQVHVNEVTTSSARKAIYSFLRIDEGPLEFTLAGVVG